MADARFIGRRVTAVFLAPDVQRLLEELCLAGTGRSGATRPRVSTPRAIFQESAQCVVPLMLRSPATRPKLKELSDRVKQVDCRIRVLKWQHWRLKEPVGASHVAQLCYPCYTPPTAYGLF
jgi:hypothetical protein